MLERTVTTGSGSDGSEFLEYLKKKNALEFLLVETVKRRHKSRFYAQHSTMVPMFHISGVAFGALVAIVGSVLGAHSDEPSLLGELTGTYISARLVNYYTPPIKYSQTHLFSGGVIFEPSVEVKQSETTGDYHPVCGYKIRIELNNGKKTFCGLKIFGLISDNGDVRMILRFKGLNKGDKDCRLEIPITRLTPQDKQLISEGITTNIFEFIPGYLLGGLYSNPTSEFNFPWLAELVSEGVEESSTPFLLEGGEEKAVTIATRPVRVVEYVMSEIYSVFGVN